MENQESPFKGITEHLGTEKALKESEELFSKTFYANPAPMAISTLDGRFIDVNESYAKLTGYSRNELIGKNSVELNIINPKERDGYITKFKDNCSIKDMECEITTKSGEKRDVISSTEPIKINDETQIISFVYDITERKKAEEAILESEEKLRTLFETMPVSISVLDRDRNVIYENSALEEILGLTKEELAMGKYAKRKYIKSDMTEMSSDEIPSTKALNEQKPIKDVEIGIIKEDNRIIWTNVNAIPLSFSDWRVLIVTSDITGRKKAEIAHRESEAELARAQHIAHIGSYKWDLLTDEVKWSDESYRLLGMTPGELEPKYELFLNFIVPEDRDMVNEAVRRGIDTGENFNFTYNIIGKDGNSRIILSENETIKDESGKVIKMYGTNQDITELKKAEEELRESRDNLEEQVKERTRELEEAFDSLKESEQRYRTLFNSTPDYTILVGVDGNLIDINKAAQEITGLSSYDLIGKNFTELEILVDEEMPLHMEKFSQILKVETVDSYESRFVDKNGEIRYVETYLEPLKKDNEIFAFDVISHDITERKKAEEQLKETIKELKRSNQELQQFAYVASHDLQEPLRTIASFTQLLERRYKGQLDSNADEFMDYIVEAATRMKAQIEGLLEYSRVVTKGEEFELVDMNNVLNKTLKILDTSIIESDTKITSDELPNVMGDTLQLERVFQNLISNAIKFRKRKEPPKIHISAYKSKDEKEYIFSVQDNGIGIEKQYLERIFTIFQRLHTRDVYKGTGIGLSIVKRIIERHGGRIWVESEFGVGSTFYFILPVEPVETGGIPKI
ncbi:MAG: PAS domain S-box protein [Methanobacterium sp.]